MKNTNSEMFLDCKDVVSHVFSFCSIKQLGSITTVNRRFQSLSKEELTQRKQQIAQDYANFGLVYAGKSNSSQTNLIKHLNQFSVDETHLHDLSMLSFKYEYPVKLFILGDEYGKIMMQSLSPQALDISHTSKEIAGRMYKLEHVTHTFSSKISLDAYLKNNNIVLFLNNNDMEFQVFLKKHSEILQEKLLIYIRTTTPNTEESKTLLEHDLEFSKKLGKEYGMMISILNMCDQNFRNPIIGTKILEKIDQKFLLPLARQITEAEEKTKKTTPQKKQKETCIIS